MNVIDEVHVEHVWKALLLYGLRLREKDITRREEQEQKKVIRELLEDNRVGILVDAIKFGMGHVWPFSEDGRAFAAKDLRDNLLKAKGEVGTARRQGTIPHSVKVMIDGAPYIKAIAHPEEKL